LENNCAFCLKSDGVTVNKTSRRGYEIECRRCGCYKIDLKAYNRAIGLKESDRAVLSSWTLERRLYERPWPEFTADIDQTQREQGPIFDLEQVIRERAPRSISERLDRALANLAKKSGQPGNKVELTQDDLYLFHAVSGEQMLFWGQALAKAGWIDPFEHLPQKVKISVEGWIRLAELERTPGDPPQAFVAMSFHKRLEPAWNIGLIPGIEDAGYSPIRVDEREHNEKICDVIVAEIRKSALLVADVTRQLGFRDSGRHCAHRE
jgi:hypothetical protein